MAPTKSQETWTKIHEDTHADPYEEFIEDVAIFHQPNGGTIEVKNACVYGCGHCGAVKSTREELRKTSCMIS